VHEALVLIELGAIVLTLGLLGKLAGRIGLSPIPLYLLAGLAFGEGGLLPLGASQEFIATGSEIGVILLLLLLGLEYSAAELLTNLRQQAPSGVINLVLNSLPGVAVGLIMGWPPAAVVAMGGITYVSSSGITAKLLSDLGRLGNRETPVVLSLLVIEDLSMAVYLPLLTALLAGVSFWGGALSVGIALGAVTVALVIALRFGRALGKLVFSDNSEVLLLIVFGLALLVGGLALQAQVSEAVGAFLVGIALSGRVAESAEEVLTPLKDFFAAVFFVFFGLRIHAEDIPGVLLPALALAVVTALTKIVSAGWAAKRAGIALPGQIRAGTVMVSRGEFNIVIAGLATSAALDAPGLAALAATYVLIMAVFGPLIARAGDPLGRWVATKRPAKPKSTTASRTASGPRSSSREPETAGPAETERGFVTAADDAVTEPDGA
jgi:CPA2 family monovalent cation:H+ antiporter-2